MSYEISRKEVQDDALKQTMTAFENSKNKERNLLKEYQDPLAKTTSFISSFQEDWRQQEELREELRKKY